MAAPRHVHLLLAVILVLLAVGLGGAVTAATGQSVTSPRQHGPALSVPSRHQGPVLVARTGAETGRGTEPDGPMVAASQTLAALIEGQEVMTRPSGGSAPLCFVAATRPITGERTVLPVIGFSTGVDGVSWLEVMVPGRPDGRTGWIRELGTVSSTTRWRVVVETVQRRVVVYDDGRPVRTFLAIVGKPSTPTPLGQFFVEEVVALPAKDVGAPYALALSARSNVLQEFDGGPGQIAVHGLGNIGGVLGTAVSHGCVRLGGAAMRWLVAHVSPGVPVTITT